MSEILANEKQLKDYQAFNKGVRVWSAKVRRESIKILHNTHGSGRLKHNLEAHYLQDYNGSKAYVGLGFKFLKYGAYREYGAGRGYIVKDGKIMKGYSEWRDKETRLKRKRQGWSDYRIRRSRVFDEYDVDIKRSALPWLDPPITKSINDLADLSGEYYGDTALKKVLEKFDVITIEKRYGKK